LTKLTAAIARVSRRLQCSMSRAVRTAGPMMLAVILVPALAGPAFARSVPQTGPTVLVVKDPAGLPKPFGGFVRKGDYIISDGKYTAFVAGTPRPLWSLGNYGSPDAAGYVLALVPAGATGRPEAQFGVPSVRVGGRPLDLVMSSIRTEPGGLAVRSDCAGEGGLHLSVLVRYRFAFAAGRIDVSAEVRNAGAKDVEGLGFGLAGGALQSYSFSPFDAKAFPSLDFRVYQRPDHVLAWLDANPQGTAEEPRPGRLRPGGTYRVSCSLAAAATVSDALENIYGLVRVRTVKASVEIKNHEGPAEIIVRDPATGAVFYREFFASSRGGAMFVPLPAGTYEVRANLFPAVVEKIFRAGGTGGDAPWSLEPPPQGRLRVTVKDRKGRPVRSKVSFIGLAPAGSPYFLPEDPVISGRSWERSKNSVYPFGDGLDVVLPAGTYLAVASHGPEDTMDTRAVEILGGQEADLSFTIDRAVDTRGLVSLDSHMHTTASDGYVGIAERLRSVVAEGVDVAVSADHNFVVDYGPELERLGLAGDLAVVSGVEVTARSGSIHFNSLPAAVRPGEPGNGAIDVRDETPAKLFALARDQNPGSLVHVNHPRSGRLGYFLNYALDPDKAASAEAPFDPGFDLAEAMNGARFEGANRSGIDDWFHLVNRGYPIRIVGSSDAHGIAGGEPGYSRTYVLYGGGEARDLDRAALFEAVKAGRSFVSNGPIVAVRANRRATFGDMVKAKSGGRVDLDITVTGAPWLDVSEVRLVVDGERQPPLAMKGGGKGAVKFRDRVRVEFARDGWVAVEVLGRRSLFPLIQQRPADGTVEAAALPYALTNPIFVDADGDGRSDPVWPEKLEIKQPPGRTKPPRAHRESPPG